MKSPKGEGATELPSAENVFSDDLEAMEELAECTEEDLSQEDQRKVNEAKSRAREERAAAEKRAAEEEAEYIEQAKQSAAEDIRLVIADAKERAEKLIAEAKAGHEADLSKIETTEGKIVEEKVDAATKEASEEMETKLGPALKAFEASTANETATAQKFEETKALAEAADCEKEKEKTAATEKSQTMATEAAEAAEEEKKHAEAAAVSEKTRKVTEAAAAADDPAEAAAAMVEAEKAKKQAFEVAAAEALLKIAQGKAESREFEKKEHQAAEDAAVKKIEAVGEAEKAAADAVEEAKTAKEEFEKVQAVLLVERDATVKEARDKAQQHLQTLVDAAREKGALQFEDLEKSSTMQQKEAEERAIAEAKIKEAAAVPTARAERELKEQQAERAEKRRQLMAVAQVIADRKMAKVAADSKEAEDALLAEAKEREQAAQAEAQKKVENEREEARHTLQQHVDAEMAKAKENIEAEQKRALAELEESAKNRLLAVEVKATEDRVEAEQRLKVLEGQTLLEAKLVAAAELKCAELIAKAKTKRRVDEASAMQIAMLSVAEVRAEMAESRVQLLHDAHAQIDENLATNLAQVERDCRQDLEIAVGKQQRMIDGVKAEAKLHRATEVEEVQTKVAAAEAALNVVQDDANQLKAKLEASQEEVKSAATISAKRVEEKVTAASKLAEETRTAAEAKAKAGAAASMAEAMAADGEDGEDATVQMGRIVEKRKKAEAEAREVANESVKVARAQAEEETKAEEADKVASVETMTKDLEGETQKVQEGEATFATLQQELDALVAAVKAEEAKQIEEVGPSSQKVYDETAEQIRKETEAKNASARAIADERKKAAVDEADKAANAKVARAMTEAHQDREQAIVNAKEAERVAIAEAKDVAQAERQVSMVRASAEMERKLAVGAAATEYERRLRDATDRIEAEKGVAKVLAKMEAERKVTDAPDVVEPGRAAAEKRARDKAAAQIEQITQEAKSNRRAASFSLKAEMDWAKTDASGKAEEASSTESQLAQGEENRKQQLVAVKANTDRTLSEAKAKAEIEYRRATAQAAAVAERKMEQAAKKAMGMRKSAEWAEKEGIGDTADTEAELAAAREAAASVVAAEEEKNKAESKARAEADKVIAEAEEKINAKLAKGEEKWEVERVRLVESAEGARALCQKAAEEMAKKSAAWDEVDVKAAAEEKEIVENTEKEWNEWLETALGQVKKDAEEYQENLLKAAAEGEEAGLAAAEEEAQVRLREATAWVEQQRASIEKEAEAKEANRIAEAEAKAYGRPWPPVGEDGSDGSADDSKASSPKPRGISAMFSPGGSLGGAAAAGAAGAEQGWWNLSSLVKSQFSRLWGNADQLLEIEAAKTSDGKDGESGDEDKEEGADCANPTLGEWCGDAKDEDGEVAEAVEGDKTPKKSANLTQLRALSPTDILHPMLVREDMTITPQLHRFLAFDNRFFRAGDAVKGVVVIVCPRHMRASGIDINWLGVEEVGHLNESGELVDVRGAVIGDDGAGEGTVTGYKKRTIFDESVRLWAPDSSTSATSTDGEEAEGILPRGPTVLPFSWMLPGDLPRSVEPVTIHKNSMSFTQFIGTGSSAVKSTETAQHKQVNVSRQEANEIKQEQQVQENKQSAFSRIGLGKGKGPVVCRVRYTVQVVMHSREESLRRLPPLTSKLTVYEYVDPVSSDCIPSFHHPIPLNQPVERTSQMSYLFGGAHPCVATVRLDRPVLVPGKAVRVKMLVYNGSTRTVSGFRYSLVRRSKAKHEAEASTEVVLSGPIAFHDESMSGKKGEDGQAKTVDALKTKMLSTMLPIPVTTAGSVTRGELVSVTHELLIELQVMAASSLIVRMPVYVVESILPDIVTSD
jgi:hypothetical protein